MEINTKTKIKYSKSAVKAVKNRIKSDVIKATKANPEALAEIQAVFHKANRRIQNLTNSKADLISPALVGLRDKINLDGKNKVAKFSTKGKTWFELKMEYGYAVSFLNNITSTASGAKDFAKHLKNDVGFKGKDGDKKWQEYKDKLNAFYAGTEGRIRANEPYEKRMQRLYDMKAQTLGNAMQKDAEATVRRIESNIERFGEEVSTKATEKLEDAVKGFRIDTK